MLKRFAGAALVATTALASAANPITGRIFTADPAALVDGGRFSSYLHKHASKSCIVYHNGKIMPVPQTAQGPAANPSAACK